MPPESGTPILTAKAIGQSFSRPDGSRRLILDHVDLSLSPREMVGLVGRSGAGKSTLLRIIDGLITPTTGEVAYHGRPLSRPTKGIAMVFQTFALFPWLTVLENVEIGLEAQGVPPDELRRRSLEAVDLIGLDGFESAYPRELSSGMRQRVGFARALVVQPDLLLMDEPFSALDVLTAETLRTDFLDLWLEGKTSLSSVLLVTHNIEEAVVLCDRVLVLSSDPARITAEVRVTLKQPRERHDAACQDLVDQIYASLTSAQARGTGGAGGIAERLPRALTSQMAGLMETLASSQYGGRAELSRLARRLQLDTTGLLEVADALQLLGFAEVTENSIHLTTAGRLFVDGDPQVRKTIFAQHLSRNVPLASYIRRRVQKESGHRIKRQVFLQELQEHLTVEEAEAVLQTATGWGRYAEIYAYDENSETFSLE